MIKNKKIAIVYDWLDSWGGIERVLLTLHEMIPGAVFFTSYYDKKKASWVKDLPILPSFIQKLPAFLKNNRVLSVPFYPFAFESFDFSDFDIVISITSSFAKAVITRPETVHICYLLTPTRFLWTSPQDYLSENIFKKPLINHLKKWDLIVAQRPDYYVTISKTVQKRLKEIYNRDSEVIYPPFDIDYWGNIKEKETRNKKQETNKSDVLNSKFYLVVSRLEPYKKVDSVVQMFKHLNTHRLIVVGNGSQFAKLKSLGGDNVTFRQNVSDSELANLYSSAEALIMPQEEDFGLVSLEAQFFGCPVISYKRGGAAETVVVGKTGLFFEDQSIAAIRDSLAKFDKMSYTLKQSVREFGPKNVQRFARKNFDQQFSSFVNEKITIQNAQS